MFKKQMHDRRAEKDQAQHRRQHDEDDHAQPEPERCPEFLQRAARRLRRKRRQNGHRQCHAENAQRELDQPHAVEQIGGRTRNK